MPDRSRVIVGATFAVAIIVSIFIASHTWERVRTRSVRTIEVTGAAKQRITSDLAEWSSTMSAEDPAAAAAFKALHEQSDKVRAYLKAQGIADADVRVGSATREEVYDEVPTEAKDGSMYNRRVFKGYRITQSVSVRSTDVEKIERLSREVTSLLEEGVNIESHAPAYFYTKLGDLKIQMLAEAAKDARNRADKIIASAASGHVSGLQRSDMGVINVNRANSTETSWEGNNDTSSVEKDIITVVHCTFDVSE